MDIQDLKKHCGEVIKNYPQLKEEVVDLYNLCVNEIEEGDCSVHHEINLCMSDIDFLVWTKVQSI